MFRQAVEQMAADLLPFRHHALLSRRLWASQARVARGLHDACCAVARHCTPCHAAWLRPTMCHRTRTSWHSRSILWPRFGIGWAHAVRCFTSYATVLLSALSGRTHRAVRHRRNTRAWIGHGRQGTEPASGSSARVQPAPSHAPNPVRPNPTQRVHRQRNARCRFLHSTRTPSSTSTSGSRWQ